MSIAKLREMVANYKVQIPSLITQAAELSNKILDNQEQVESLGEIQTSETGSTTGILEAKRAALEILYGRPVYAHFGADYGISNLTDWYLYITIPWFFVVYQYGGQGWDDNKTLKCLFEEFDFFKDYIEIDINIELYGLDSLTAALEAAKVKVDSMIAKYETALARIEAFLESGVSGCLIRAVFDE